MTGKGVPAQRAGRRKAEGGGIIYSLPTRGSFQDSVVSTIGDITAIDVPYINHAKILADTPPDAGQLASTAMNFAPLMGAPSATVSQGGMPGKISNKKKPAAKKKPAQNAAAPAKAASASAKPKPEKKKQTAPAKKKPATQATASRAPAAAKPEKKSAAAPGARPKKTRASRGSAGTSTMSMSGGGGCGCSQSR